MGKAFSSTIACGTLIVLGSAVLAFVLFGFAGGSATALATAIACSGAALVGAFLLGRRTIVRKNTQMCSMPDASQIRFKELVEQVKTVVWEFDAQARQFTYVSPAAAFLGFSIDAWYAPGFWPRCVHLADREWMVRLRREQVAAGQEHRIRYRMVAADGRTVWVNEDVSKPDRSLGGTILRGTLNDVTAEVAYEEALLRAQHEANAANQSKSAFLASMSHEIRTPMTAILGYAELLDDDGDRSAAPVRRLDNIDTIRRNGEHLLAIINDILDLSKIEAGKLSIERIPTRLDHTIRDVLSLMSMKARTKGLTLRAAFTTPIPAAIRTDPVRVCQILTNLIGNAIKFTERGGITVEVSFQQSIRDMIQFAVVDTGIGLSHEHQAKIFDAFEQASVSTTRKFGGTGLGLHISRRLANLLGGEINVVSRVGVGSTFTVTIDAGDTSGIEMIQPRGIYAASERQADAPCAPPLVPPSREPLTDVRVLLVEDGPDNQRLLAFHLRKAGAVVLVADNGRRAIELLTENGSIDGGLLDPLPADLIVMDMQMPEMDGYAATRWLRGRGVNIPIIALTAHAMSGDSQRCIEAGCDEYATKPINRATLIDVCLRAARRGGVVRCG